MINYSYRDKNRRLKENASRKRSTHPSRRRRMNEEYDKVLWVDYEGQYFDRSLIMEIITMKTVLIKASIDLTVILRRELLCMLYIK